eukprot:446556_1
MRFLYTCVRLKRLKRDLLTGSNLTLTAGGAGVLTTDTETAGVADTTMGTDLLHALQIVTELDVNGVGQDVLGLAGLGVTLTVQEPHGDLELGGVGKDVGDALELVGLEGTGAALGVDTSLLEDQVGETDTDTLDGAQGEGDLALTINVGVQETNDVLELANSHSDGSHIGQQ